MADIARGPWRFAPSKWRVGDRVHVRLKNGGVAGPFTVTACIPPKDRTDSWRYEIADETGLKVDSPKYEQYTLGSNLPSSSKSGIIEDDIRRPEPEISTSKDHGLQSESLTNEGGYPQSPLTYHITDSGYGGSGASKFSSINKALGLPSTLATSVTGDVSASGAASTQFDARTVYSDTASLADPTLLEYVAAFGNELSGSLPSDFDKLNFEKVSPFLDELLQTFALKMSSDGDTQEHRSLTYLIYRYRSQITENLRQRYDDLAEQDDKRPTTDDEMTVEDKMELLWGNVNLDTNIEDAFDHGVDNIPEDETYDETIQLPHLDRYQELIKMSPAYEWLTWKIGTLCRIACPGTYNAQEIVRNRILRGINAEKHFHRGKPPMVAAQYVVLFDPFEFHAKQQYTCNVAEVLAKAITITGEGNNVQAATCLEYISQTWGSPGISLLAILELALNHHLDGTHTFTSPYSTIISPADVTISANYSNGKFEVLALGIPYSVAEVGEVLTWLASALQSSPSDRAASCNPCHKVKVGSLLDGTLQVEINSSNSIADEFVDDVAQRSSRMDPDQTGSCWLQCFRNPMIVEGYPILRRYRDDSGLEVSLDIMLELTSANFLVDFSRRTVLKGFSVMLALMEKRDSTILWHMFFNEPGAYISYEDIRVPRLDYHETEHTVTPDVLAKSRHILGWCKEVSCLAGTKHASYDIDWSGLRKPHSFCAFDKVSISAGKYLSVGASLSIGIKDKSEHVSFEDDYLSTLLMISERFFLIYDVEERRAWLLDGVTTLLHLLRAFIKYSQDDSLLQDFFILNENDIQEGSDDKKGRMASFSILANEKNQRLPLWRKTMVPTEEYTMKDGDKTEEALKLQTSYFCFKDRVLQICRLLQQATAHHDDVHTRDGVGARIKGTPRRQLEGFDFMDVATHQGTLWPKVGEIHAWGEGWVDFTRELHCATLFGVGFGELMRGVGLPCELCMSNVPQGPDLLAVTCADLQRIIKRKGDKRGREGAPRRIIEDIYWYVPEKLFDDCTCSQYIGKPQSDRVQVFIPTSHPKAWGKGGPNLYLPEDGAILVGHSFKFPLRWGFAREPEKVQPEVPTKRRITLQRDSGIGSSGSSASAKSQESLKHRHENVARHSLRELNDRKTPPLGSSLYLHAN
ncbi:unnamed protein product [Periconia digitata]|uniref:Uncharacterized protein n=1 Tax=Periconia digitata TaxID=1303443 RepID=A0A9W4UPK6_9PLEO|nr:unnamed protein product [Periconia digitata]